MKVVFHLIYNKKSKIKITYIAKFPNFIMYTHLISNFYNDHNFNLELLLCRSTIKIK